MSGCWLRSALRSRMLRFVGFVGALAVIAVIASAGTSISLVTPPNLPAGWRNWRYAREVDLQGVAATGLVVVTLPEDVYAHSSNHLADIRVVDDQGREVPYVLDVPYGETRTERRRVRKMENSFVPGEFTQIVLDVGEKERFHNAIVVNTPASDFVSWAEVAVSDDALQWRIVCDRAPLFRFSQQNLQGTQTLHYSDTNARYIRLRVLDGKQRLSISGVEVLYEITSPSKRVAVAAPIVSVASPNPHESVWEADLSAELPANALSVETTEPEFSRLVSVESSEDRSEWTPAGTGEIYRFHRDDVLREWPEISFSGGWSAHWRGVM